MSVFLYVNYNIENARVQRVDSSSLRNRFHNSWTTLFLKKENDFKADISFHIQHKICEVV